MPQNPSSSAKTGFFFFPFYRRTMEVPHGILAYIAYSILFIPVFVFLFMLGMIKAAMFSPFVFLVIAFGDLGIVMGLWPLHLCWSAYCIVKSKKFGPFMKGALILSLPIPIAIWTLIGVFGSVIMGVGYAFGWPLMETFRVISKPGVANKLIRCITDGTWTNVWGACTIVRDFGDFSFHSYFSVMDELLEAKEDEKPLELKLLVLPGCIIAAALGVFLDVPIITLLVIYKAPIMLFKGWHRLVEDLIGRSGPFLETVCVPFAAFLILLWPFAVILAVLGGLIASFGFGLYAAVVAYQENSTKKGLIYVVASVALFDEYTNDILSLQEGSCFPRPKYREAVDDGPHHFPLKGLHERIEAVHAKHTLTRTSSDKVTALKAIVIWDIFFKGCKRTGEVLLRDGAIGIQDLEEWQHSKNKIINIGVPACTFLQCFFKSIKSGSTGFIMGDNTELTYLNRPEGRIFDWLYDPMCLIKEQLKSLNLVESEELYLSKLSLYCGDTQRIEALQNVGVPPSDDIRRAQLEGISRRLQGICLTVSRLPTFRRRFSEVVKTLMQEAKQKLSGYEGGDPIEATV